MLEVCERDSDSAQRELAAYKHLGLVKTTHAGTQFVRQLLDSFEIRARDGKHLCMVHEPLGMSVHTLRKMLSGEKLSEDMLKSVLKYLLLALNYLHNEGNLVHTGEG